MALGTVKWFNPTKGYGFIKPDDGGSDVFVHISAVERAGFTNLAEGAKISYELKVDPRRARAALKIFASSCAAPSGFLARFARASYTGKSTVAVPDRRNGC
jgi:cold shock protein